MPTTAGMLPFSLVVIIAVSTVHAIPLRSRRLSDPDESARCSGDLSSPIPVGCPVEMTAEQKVLQFVCSYTDLLEVCTWSVDGVSVGSTTQYYKQHIFDSGLVAVVSNNVPGQSDLTLYNVASPLAGMEVMCSCQVQGEEQGPPRTAKTAIVDEREV